MKLNEIILKEWASKPRNVGDVINALKAKGVTVTGPKKDKQGFNTYKLKYKGVTMDFGASEGDNGRKDEGSDWFYFEAPSGMEGQDPVSDTTVDDILEYLRDE